MSIKIKPLADRVVLKAVESVETTKSGFLLTAASQEKSQVAEVFMRYNYRTSGTCSREISFDLDGNIVRNVSFVGGCNGNLKAVSALVEGSTVEEINRRCAGITCGMKQTSCADQLARAVQEAFKKSSNT